MIAHRRLLVTIGLFAIVLLHNVTSLVAEQATELGCRDNVVVVDLEARTVNGVSVDRSIAELQSALGARRIVSLTEYVEGRPVTAWDIDFCGHKARRHWNGLSWTDPAFRTTDGLGVGSPLSAFDDRYGGGTPFESESTGVRYPLGEDRTEFTVSVKSACYRYRGKSLFVDRRCAVTAIFLSLRAELSRR